MSGTDDKQASDRTPNVFLSYARTDEPSATKLVSALEAAGLEVWWDARIEGGAEFARSIEAALDRCDAVVVLWSAASVKSGWVLDEASRGRQQSKLVPVSLDGTGAPLGFGQFQAVNLTGWNGEPRSAAIDSLLRGIASATGHALHHMPQKAAPPVSPPATSRHRTRPVVAGVVAAAAVAILAFVFRPGQAPPPGPTPQAASPREEARDPPAVLDNTVAVLRFVNLDGSEQTQVFSDGLADDLITALTGVPGLYVSSRGDSFTLEPNAGSARVRERLRVAHYLEGSIEVRDETMRAVVQLVDSASGFQVLSRKFDRPLKDFFALRDEITRLTVANVRVALPEYDGSTLAVELDAHDLDAYVAYRRGRELLKGAGGIDRLEEAIGYYQQALSIDPQYAAAHAGLCDAYCARFGRSNSAADVETAERACAAALAASPRLYLVHTSLGSLYQLTGRTDEAERAYRTALEANPGDVRAMIGLARLLASRQDHDAAEDLFRQAMATQPGSMVTLGSYAQHLFEQGRYADAAEFYGQAAEMDAGDYELLGNLASALMLAGQLEEAKRTYEAALELGEYDIAYYNLGVVHYFLWDFDKSVSILRKAIDMSPNTAVSWSSLGDSLHFAGRPAESAEAFRRSVELAEARLAVASKDGDTMRLVAWGLHNLGQREQAQAMLQKASSLSPQQPYAHYYDALINAGNGNRDAALEALRRAVESGYPPALLAADPYFGEFRTDPAFDAALAAAH